MTAKWLVCGQVPVLLEEASFVPASSPFVISVVFLTLTILRRGKRGRDGRFWIRRLAQPNLQMHGFCNLLARPVFMSMLIVGSATVQF